METIPLDRSLDRSLSTDSAPRREMQPISISRALGKVIVTVHGHVNAELALSLHRLLLDIVDGCGSLDVILDLRYLNSLHPVGIDSLADVAARVARHGGAITISDPHGKVPYDLEGATHR